MSERTFTGTGGGSNDFERTVWRRTREGTLVEEDIEFNDYVHPPKTRGRFRLNGWSPFYQAPDSFNPGKTKTRVRAEYLILKMPRARELEGRLFDQQFPVPKNIDHPEAKLGQFFSALLDRKIEEGETINMDDFIGTEFVTTVTRDEDGDHIYCGISWEGIEPDQTKLSPYVNGGAPELAPVRATTDGEEAGPFEQDNPFEQDDL